MSAVCTAAASAAAAGPGGGAAISVVSMNMLSPGYFRKTDRSTKKRVEASHVDAWTQRLRQQYRCVRELSADVTCLQELWFKPAQFDLMHEALGDAHEVVAAQRTGKKEDGVALLIRRDRWAVRAQLAVHLDAGAGDRSMAMALIEPAPGVRGQRAPPPPPPPLSPLLLVATTHMTFPHDAHDAPVRLRQAQAIVRHLDEFAALHGAADAPVILSGDLNGESSDPAVRLLLDHGFESGYAACRGGREAAVTHLDHNGHAAGVDFVLYRCARGGAGGAARLRPAAAVLLPECAPDTAMMARPVVQHPADVAAASASLAACGRLSPASEVAVLGSHRELGSPPVGEPSPAAAAGAGADPAAPALAFGLFASTQPLSELTFEQWCQMTDHRAVAVRFDLEVG